MKIKGAIYSYDDEDSDDSDYYINYDVDKDIKKNV